MRYLITLTLFVFLNSIQFAAYSQQDSIPVVKLVEMNTQLNRDSPFEKVYLHFDKPYYAVGDTMWFKTYLTSLQNVPSPLSKIVYVDVLTHKDSIVSTLKLPVINGTAQGSVPLSPFSYKQGNYHIRAYTKWMMNFSPDYFFTKNITIGNSINKELITHINFNSNTSEKNVKVTATIQFKGEDDRPLANKRVNWEVIADFDRVGRGRGDTDAKGVLTIDFSSSKDVDIRAGELITTIDLGNNKSINKTFPLTTVLVENDVQFFPEGGALIAGLPTQVGFKAINSNGLGLAVSGQIVAADGSVVAQLSSEHLGMGKFSFTPADKGVYFANVTFADGSKGTYNLPAVQTAGLGLTVDNSDPVNIKFSIRANQPFLDKNRNTGFYIIGRNSGIVYYAAQSVLRNTEYTSVIPKKNFPSGIAQLSVLSSNGKVLSERVVFIRQADSLQMKLTAELPTYKARQQVKMKLAIKNPLDTTTFGDFSVAVIDETKVPVNEDKETTIFSSMLLSSELTGYIENPNYYFYNVTDQKLAKLDLLMLTQGYRRYLYEDIVGNKKPAFKFFPEQSLAVSGIIRRSDGMPLANGRLLLQIPERSFYKDGTTDDKGRFIFDNLVFQDSVEVIVNARNNLNSENLMINVDGDPFPSPTKNINTPDNIINIDSSLNTYLTNNRLSIGSGFLLKEVAIAVTPGKRPSHSDHSSLTGLSMQPDYFVKGEQVANCNDLLTCISSVSGLIYSDNYLYLSRTYNAGGRTPVEIYVNGMPVDVSYLHSIQPAGIESIEVFLDDGLTGINSRTNTQGVVVINMKEIKKVKLSKQDIKDLFPPTNILTLTPAGYSVERQFYVPRYSGPRTSLQSPDNRSTIYWNPNLVSDEDGVVEFDYFTADSKGTYRVVVEGVDSQGYIGRSVLRYQVE